MVTPSWKIVKIKVLKKEIKSYYIKEKKNENLHLNTKENYILISKE